MFSLPDWAYYPIAALVTIGMVTAALSGRQSTYRSPEEIRAEGISVSGDELAGIVLGNGLSAELLRDGEESFLRIGAARGPFDGIRSAGAFFRLSPSQTEAVQGHSVRITYTLRQAEENGAEGVRLAFFVPGIGQSAWQRFEVGTDYAPQSIEVTANSCDWTHALMGMWPDWEGDATQIDVQSVTLELLEPLNC